MIHFVLSRYHSTFPLRHRSSKGLVIVTNYFFTPLLAGSDERAFKTSSVLKGFKECGSKDQALHQAPGPEMGGASEV
jgi:hypothetical protein